MTTEEVFECLIFTYKFRGYWHSNACGRVTSPYKEVGLNTKLRIFFCDLVLENGLQYDITGIG